MGETQSVRRRWACRTCREDVSYRSELEVGVWDAGWVHAATGKALSSDHMASPVPRCSKCQSAEYGSEDSPWGIAWSCRACGHQEYYSIGD